MTTLRTADLANALTGHLETLEPLKGASLFVTGGTGFLGSWVAETVAYLNDHHGFGTSLTLLGRVPKRFEEVAPHLAQRPDIKLLAGNVRDLVELSPDTAYVIHAAASPDTRQHASEPTRTIRTIVDGTFAVLEAASRSSSVARIANVSSGLVYGPQPDGRLTIDEGAWTGMDPNAFTSSYAEGKRSAEAIVTAYRSQHRLPIVTLRPFTFCGAYQPLEGPWAFNNFVRDGLLGGPIRIQGSGDTVRSLMYGSDAAVWTLVTMLAGTVGEAYNLGSPEAVSLKELAQAVSRIVPKRPEIVVRGGRELRLNRFVPDVAKARDELGLRITVDLEGTIERSISYYQDRIGRCPAGVHP